MGQMFCRHNQAKQGSTQTTTTQKLTLSNSKFKILLDELQKVSQTNTLFESQGCFLPSGKKKHSVTDHNDTQSVEKNSTSEASEIFNPDEPASNNFQLSSLEKKKDEHLLSSLAFINV